MSTYFPSLSGFNFFSPISNLAATTKTNPSLDFQDSIKHGNIDQVKQLLANEGIVNKPLPNGELPLHFAVCLNNIEIIRILLDNNADPYAKDHQGLNSIDHALIMKHENALGTILGIKSADVIKELQKQMQHPGSIKQLNSLKTEVESFFKENFDDELSKLKTIQSALEDFQIERSTVKGKLLAGKVKLTGKDDDVSYLTNLYSKLETMIKSSDSISLPSPPNGEGEIHLIRFKSKSNDFFFCEDMFLHGVVTTGSRELLIKALKLGIDPNDINTRGNTPMHFAAAKGRLDLIVELIKAGGKIDIKNEDGLSPLSILAIDSLSKDPLSVKTIHGILFASNCLFWLSVLILDTAHGLQYASEITNFRFLFANISNLTEWVNLLKSMGGGFFKKALIVLSVLGAEHIIPFFSVGIQTWQTYHVASAAFQALKTSWINFGIRKWKALQVTAVHAINLSHSLYKLHVITQIPTKINKHAFYWVKILSEINGPEGSMKNAYNNYLKYLQGEHISFKDDRCPEIGLLETISDDRTRLLNPNLNPQCKEHALKLLAPWATFDECLNQCQNLYLKNYKDYSLIFHPDKSNDGTEIMQRIGTARNTLKDLNLTSQKV